MKFLDPNYAIKQFGIYGTQDVADFGAGSGHFSLAAARRLDGGRLFAIDVDKEMLRRLVSEAKLAGHENLHPLWGDISRKNGVPLANETIDRVIISNVLFQIDDRTAMIQEAKRLLRPEGKILLIDWNESSNIGPHKKHKVSENVAVSLFKNHGFKKENNIDAGDEHYGIILTRD